MNPRRQALSAILRRQLPFLLGSLLFSHAFLALAQSETPLKLHSFFETTNARGLRVVAAFIEKNEKPAPAEAGVRFRAVIGSQWPYSTAWPEGLVPIFAVEREDSFELRRLPPRGQENASEPLFFALPREDESEATQIAGRWECVATNSEGTKHYVAWELAFDGARVAGRLDQQTDYRFAFITGGTFQSNRLQFRVEHINDRYTVTGDWRPDGIGGRWQRDDGADQGPFLATRPLPRPKLPEPRDVVPLHEWRRTNSRERRYSTDPTWSAPGWERSTLPLCRVWK